MEELYKEILRLESIYENDKQLNEIQFKCNLTALEALNLIKTFMLTNVLNEDKKIKEKLESEILDLKRYTKILECEAKNDRDEALKRMMEEDRSGVEERVHCHKSRRTGATRLLNQGMRIEGVQGILGHTTPATTQIYAQLSQENLRNEYRRLVV